MLDNPPYRCVQLPTDSLGFVDFGKIVRINLYLLEICIRENKIHEIAEYYLCEEERKKFYSFRYEKRKTEWLGGRIAVKYAVLLLQNNEEKIWGKSHWQQIKIKSYSSGKPFVESPALSNNTPLYVSISHSEKWAIAIASYEDCAIDVQRVTKKVERIQQRFVTNNEIKILEKNLNKTKRLREALTLLWSAKESVKKISNIDKMLCFFDITLESVEEYENLIILKLITTLPPKYKIVKARLLDEYAYAVAFRNQEL